MLSRDKCRSHLQNSIRFGQSAGLTSFNTLTRYRYSFSSRVARCVDLMLVPVCLATLQIEECGVSEKAAPILKEVLGKFYFKFDKIFNKIYKILEHTLKRLEFL